MIEFTEEQVFRDWEALKDNVKDFTLEASQSELVFTDISHSFRRSHVAPAVTSGFLTTDLDTGLIITTKKFDFLMRTPLRKRPEPTVYIYVTKDELERLKDRDRKLTALEESSTTN